MINIRKTDISDVKDLFEWRNDNLSRKMLLNSDIIEWKDHLNWHNKVLKNDNVLVLICINEYQQKIGVVHFKIDAEIIKIAINLSAKYRGKGFSKNCIIHAINFFKNEFPDNRKICAQIKKNNIISLKLFKNCGFKFFKEVNGLQYFFF